MADLSLSEAKASLIPELPEELSRFITGDTSPVVLEYPVERYPEKVKSLNLLKSPVFEGVLAGVKGQYLLFKDGTVWNVRSHSGFEVLFRL